MLCDAALRGARMGELVRPSRDAMDGLLGTGSDGEVGLCAGEGPGLGTGLGPRLCQDEALTGVGGRGGRLWGPGRGRAVFAGGGGSGGEARV